MDSGDASIDNFQILSLSGGGYFGLYQAAILSELEEQAGKPIAQCFDLLAGTSISGIIALSLALEVPAASIRNAFERHGQNIFSDRSAPKSTLSKLVDLGQAVLRNKYKQDGLCKALSEFIDSSTLLGDLKHPVVVPAINLTQGEPQIFKTPHHKNFQRDYREKVIASLLLNHYCPTGERIGRPVL